MWVTFMAWSRPFIESRRYRWSSDPSERTPDVHALPSPTPSHSPSPVGVNAPYRVAPDTFVIPELVPGPPGTYVSINSMVIAGAEPVIVDTGNELSRYEWMEAAFSIVDPADVRWVFLSHDDHDHIGNLPAVLDACPKATLVTNWFTVERTSRAMELPLDRMRWVNPGESFDAGDRTLVAVRPPIFDSPTTRGLYDSKTGVYWAVDSFASLLPGHVTESDDVPYEMWRESFTFFAQMISPWVAMTDPAQVRRDRRRDRPAPSHRGGRRPHGAAAGRPVPGGDGLPAGAPDGPDGPAAGTSRPRCHPARRHDRRATPTATTPSTPDDDETALVGVGA